MAVSDINNLFTIKTTLALANWMVEFFGLDDKEKNKLYENINKVKPNTNGYDIYLPDRKIIAEVKSIIPVNSGNRYGAAQRDSILKDAHKLVNGKPPVKDTRDYHKIIGLLDLGERTNQAISQIMTAKENPRTQQEARLALHAAVKKLHPLDESMKATDLSTDWVYLKKVRI